MKSLFLSFVLLVGLSANAETIKSTTRPAEINPSSVTFFKSATLSNTYVSVVAKSCWRRLVEPRGLCFNWLPRRGTRNFFRKHFSEKLLILE